MLAQIHIQVSQPEMKFLGHAGGAMTKLLGDSFTKILFGLGGDVQQFTDQTEILTLLRIMVSIMQQVSGSEFVLKIPGENPSIHKFRQITKN